MADLGDSLPPELETALADLHKRDSATRDRRLAELRAAHPEHAATLDRRTAALPTEAGSADTVADVFAARTTAESPSQIGPYKILGTLGEGGMGTVHLAEQKEPVRRRVALKVIKLGMDSKQVVARFALERQALAVMSHPAIAKVFDAGTTDQGQPFFVMELVDGVPLNDYCDKHRLTLKERIHVFQQVCQGVQHAHQKGVLHRDLKPGNILVSRTDDQHVVKIIDFGLARATDHQMVAQTIFTEQGQILGTPEYMSPEQARGSALDIDTRTDIYSLGVILYELLAGELPFSSSELRKAGLLEIRRILVEQEPAKPSTKVSSVGDAATASANRRQLAADSLSRRLRGDLDWIVMRAMAKEPERRYESATGLALDLTRYLEDEPVLAGPPSASYRLSKILRKYRAQLTVAALVFTVAIAGALIAWRYAVVASEQESIAKTALGKSEKNEAEARRQEAIATQKEAEARRENLRFNRLSVVVHLEDARGEAKDLQRMWPAQTEKMRTWLELRGQRLARALPEVRQTVRELRETALRQTDAQKLAFASAADEFLYETMLRAESELVAFLGANGPRVAMQRRLKWAERIDALTKNHPNARVTWASVREALRKADGKSASELYAARHQQDHPIDLKVQTGLVPIGMNPKTKLWEFYHLRSAYDPRTDPDPAAIAIPKHDPGDGSIPVTERTGIVFVLLPGGTYRMGAQNTDESGANYDPLAEANETPRQETLAPFFLARHELTQGQWSRLSLRENPSEYPAGRDMKPKRVTLQHPVENVDWHHATALLEHHGLQLPHEVEWEYGCRSGTASAWFPGDDAEKLDGYANIMDAFARKQQPDWTGDFVAFDDGHAFHAPVGTFKANAFGLHDMHGNVWEWCRNLYSSSSRDRVSRGGSCYFPAEDARSALRLNLAPSIHVFHSGLRPARVLR